MSQAAFNTNWKSLYRVGGTAVLIAAGLEVAAALIVAISFSSVPPPNTVIGSFNLLQYHRFLGLVDLGLFDIAALALLIPRISPSALPSDEPTPRSWQSP
jgi:hypothetical protein